MFALVMYVFGVMCTELFGEIDYTDLFYEDKLGEYDYFSRLDKTIFTLFVMVTLDWAKVTRATMREYSWAWAIFSTFVTFSSFVLYNLIIAVVCDAVKMVQDKQDILMVENYVKDKIESRHRIINLRQKLDKMSKQQMDLLLYVKLLMEQLDDIDEETKEQYEKTLLLLGRTTGNTKEVLMNAIQQLDEIDRADGILPDGQGDDFYYYQSTNAKKKDATNETYAAEDEKTLSKDRQLKVYFRSNSERVDSLNDPPNKAAKQKSQDLVEHPENYDEDDAFMQEDRRSLSETKHFLCNEDLDGSEMFISARWNASDDSCWRDQDGVEEPSAFVKNKGTRQPCKYS